MSSPTKGIFSGTTASEHVPKSTTGQKQLRFGPPGVGGLYLFIIFFFFPFKY